MKVKLMAMLFAAGAMLGAWAETITIGSGDGNNAYLPTYCFYNYSLTQQIYTSDEIGSACNIDSIAFKNIDPVKTRNIDIYLVHTAKESFGNGNDWIAVTGVDIAFSGEVTFASGEWTTIALDVPFAYNGVDNLAVIVDDNTGSYVSSMSCLAFEADNMALRVYSDGTDYDPFDPGKYNGTIMSVKNQIQLGISDFKPVGLGVAEFEDLTYYVDEGDSLSVSVKGGCAKMPARATVYLQYQTAAAADLDLKNGDVDGLVPNGGLKFPLTLTWDKGDTEPKTIRIPVKADNLVEGNERLFLQLAEPVGMELGVAEVAQVTIVDANTKALKATVSPYRPKPKETVSSHVIDVLSGSRRGFVAGTGEYTAGTKLTIVAEARPDSEFVGWEKDGAIVSEKAKYQFTVSEDATYTALFAETVYIDGVAISADGGKATGSGYCPAGKKVTLKATANKNNRFVGWYAIEPGSVVEPEPGVLPPPPPFDRASLVLVAETPSLVIDRTAKPGKSTATSTVITDVDMSTSFFAVFEQDPLVSVIPVDGDGVNYDAGKVTGAGRYEPGKKVTLKATANKDHVFAGFYNSSRRLVDETRSATYTFEMGDVDVPLTALFVSPEADEASIKVVASIPDYDGPVVLDAENPDAFVTYCGVAADCLIKATALSATTVKASGLPPGVKLVQDKATGTWSLTGAPTAASKYDSNGDPEYYKVKLTVTTAGKSSKTYLNYWRVEPLPDWAVGTFDGAVLENAFIKATKDAFFPETTVEGIFSMTIAATGKISGKYQLDGTSWTFSAASFDYVDMGWRGAVQPDFGATLIAKSGKEVVTNLIEISGSSTCDPKGDKVPRGTVYGDFYYGEGMGRIIQIEGAQNLWKTEPWKSAMKDFVQNTPTYAEDVWDYDGDSDPVWVGTVSLKFATSGAVTAKGDFVVDYNPTTKKDITYSATCSTTFIPMIDGCGESISFGSKGPNRDVLLAEPELPGAVYVVFPPNAQKGFPGWSKVIPIGDPALYIE